MAARNALPARTCSDIASPGDLIAGVAGILGFPPTDSIVVIAFAPDKKTGDFTLSSAMRTDLPPPGAETEVAGQLCLAAGNTGAELAAAIVVCNGVDPPELPHRELVGALEQVLDEHGIEVVHATWVPGVRAGEAWRCYADADCAGVVPDPRDSPFARAATPPDAPQFASRAEMAAQLTPDDADALARRGELVAGYRASGTETRHRAVVRAALDRAATCVGPPGLDDTVIASLGAALSSPEARDECFAGMLGANAARVERLWLALTRLLPAPHRAEPACLLAMHAYLRGEGVLAGIALDAALDARPDHRLAQLLRDTIDTGTPPDRLRRFIASSVAAAGGAR